MKQIQIDPPLASGSRFSINSRTDFALLLSVQTGGTTEWDGATPAAADTEEYRIDSTDGDAYSKADFIAQYGGGLE